jgi:transcriptional regulator with XRE-family HTH domain
LIHQSQIFSGQVKNMDDAKERIGKERIGKERIGKVLKKLRKARKMKQEDLAAFVGKSAGAVGQIERGEIYPHYETLAKIINIFDADANLFFFKEASNQPELSRWISDWVYGMTDDERKGTALILEKLSFILKQPDDPD